MGFNQYYNLQCLMGLKFLTTEPSGSEEEDFLNIFQCISMVRTQDPLQRIQSGPWWHYLNKVATEQNSKVYFICKSRTQVVLKKRFFEYFSMYFPFDCVFLWFKPRTF